MQPIFSDQAPAAVGPYSQALSVNGFLFASGQIPINPATGTIDGTTIEEQTRQVMRNIEAVLTAAGTDFAHVVKTTCFLKSIGDFAAFNAIYGEYFTSRPARSCVEVSALPKGALVEVEVIATLD
ncbi:MAG: RidA family protein [Thermoguttaceae bacterium]|nr:RidA family protein [Thermoguttaceae bacterium]